jgi:hypothetical protein
MERFRRVAPIPRAAVRRMGTRFKHARGVGTKAGAAASRRRYHSISTCRGDDNAFVALLGRAYVRPVAAMVAVANQGD